MENDSANLGWGHLVVATDHTERSHIPPQDVSAASPMVAWTCGYGSIMRTIDGATWTRVYNGPAWTGSISAADDEHAIAVGGVGEDEPVLWTANGGATWNSVSTGAQYLREVDMVSSSVAYCVGSNGAILRTDNGGASWTPRSVSSAYQLGAVDFISSTEGWVAGSFEQPTGATTYERRGSQLAGSVHRHGSRRPVVNRVSRPQQRPGRGGR